MSRRPRLGSLTLQPAPRRLYAPTRWRFTVKATGEPALMLAVFGGVALVFAVIVDVLDQRARCGRHPDATPDAARTELFDASAEGAFDLERARRTLLAWNDRVGCRGRSSRSSR